MDKSKCTEVTPYLAPQETMAKSRSNVVRKDYEPLPNSTEYASAICVYYSLLRESVTDNDVSALRHSEVPSVNITSTDDEDDVYSDPGHSEAAVHACFEKKRFRKIKRDDIRYYVKCVSYTIILTG